MATLGELYELTVRLGREADPRGENGVRRILADARKELDALPEDRRWEFDQERLTNPYTDTRILFGRPDTEVGRLLVGIDVGVAELLLADRLTEKDRPIDLVVAHHPEGRALADLDLVMPVMADIWRSFGVPVHYGDMVLSERRGEVKRGFHANNNQQVVAAARLLDLPFLCCHTPADNNVQAYVQGRCDELGEDATVAELIAMLKTIPEYREAVIQGTGPMLFQGDEDARVGRVMADMTGGTSGPADSLERIAAAGVGTIVGMHIGEDRRKKAQKLHLNVVIAGHMASDSLGMNLVFDHWERAGVEIVPCSGMIRVRR